MGPVLLAPSTDYIPDKLARQGEFRAYGRMLKLLSPSVKQPAPGAEQAPVILVPGFIAGDASLGLLTRQLRRDGHRTFRSGVGANLGCTDAMVERLIKSTEQVVQDEGRPVALVGHSRGGMLAKLAAQRRPDLVAAVVVLSAPVTGRLAVAAHVRKQLEWLFRLNRRGMARVIGEDCVVGECGTRIANELAGPLPADIPYTSVYSRSDGIIDWHSCLDPHAELVEVASSHTGMGTDPEVLRIVSERLSNLRESALTPR
jgi:hypothetical protein